MQSYATPVDSLMILAGATVSGGAVVAIADGAAVTAGPLTDPRSILGVAANGANAGGQLRVQKYGVAGGYRALSLGSPYWMGANGQPTNVVPTTGLLLYLGIAISPTQISLRIGPGILLD